MLRSCLPRHLLPATALAGSLLTGCVTVEEPVSTQDSAMRQSSVVSTSAPEFQPQQGETVAWKDDITVHAPEGIEVPAELVAGLKSRIDKQLLEKGYRLTTAGQRPDYLMHGLIVLGNDLNEHQLRDILGFEPGLVAPNQAYQKGSLLLMVVDPDTLVTDWRSVVQVFTSQTLTQQQQEERFDYIIHSLMRPLPDLTSTGR